MENSVVETKAVCKRFGSFAAVSDMDVRVNRGDIYALVGRNGAGKTTLLKMLCGLTPVTSGEITLFGGSSPSELGKARARTGSMIETPAFLPYLSAHDNLEYYAVQRGGPGRKKLDETLEFVGLSGAGSKKFRQFSLGMKQRLGLALAVMGDPELLVLDEPINGLDPMGIKEFRDIILEMNREKHTTVVISSHILGELSQIATTYSFMDRGRLIQSITAEELRENCRKALRIDVDDAAKASAALRDRLGCSKFRTEGRTILLDERMDEPQVFVRTLVESGVSVFRVTGAGITLEKYFIDMVGGEKDA